MRTELSRNQVDTESSPIAECLKVVEDQQKILRDCIEGRRFQRTLLVEHIEAAKAADAQMLAAIDKDIVDFTARLQALEKMAERFRQECKTA